VRYRAAAVEFAIGNELYPQPDGIIIQADETNVALIKVWRVEPVAITGKPQAIAQRGTADLYRKIAILFENLPFRFEADLVVYVKQRCQESEEAPSSRR
jgi:hypothetical protein